MTFPKPPPPPPTPAQCPPDRVEPKLHQVLWPAGYPCDCLVLDFEAFFSTDYSLKDLTTPEYIADPRFEVLCLAYLSADAEKPEEHGALGVVVGEEDVLEFLRDLQRRHGEDLGKLTIIMQNAEFDASVLAYRYGIHPKNIIDTLNLARAWHTRSKHDLGHLAKQFGLPAKGNTADFKDCTFRKRMVKAKGRKPKPPVQLPRMTPEQVTALCEYASNDVVLEWGVFCKLLPKLSNPYTELRIMDHTLRLFTQPCLTVDYEHGTKLIEGMRSEADKLIEKVMAFYAL